MNYRYLLSEMLIDYAERFNSEKNENRKSVYSEIISDLKLSLEIEPNQISLANQANEILEKNETPNRNKS